MPTRSILLRILFWSLAVAAFFGAVGVLFSSYQGLWRIAATSIATAGAALLLLPASVFAEKPQNRAAANATVALVIFEFLMALLAIWSPSRGDFNWRAWGTFGMAAVCGIPAIACVRMLGNRATRIAGGVGVVIALAIFLFMMPPIWVDGNSDEALAVLAGWLVPYGLLAVVCLVGAGVDRRHWRFAGVAAAVAAYAMVAYAQIHHLRGDPSVVVYITTVAAIIAHANVLLFVPLRPNQLWLRWITIGAGIVTGLFTCIAVTAERGSGNELMSRLAGACGIVAGCGTLALAVLARINRRYAQAAATPLTDLREIAIVCPLCQKKQTIALNVGARCGGCNVQFHVRLEEPRCAVCGYSLMMLTSGVCPECGTPVPASGEATQSSSPAPPGQTAYTP